MLAGAPGLLGAALLLVVAGLSQAQEAPYDQPPEAEPPYFRVRYEAGSGEGELKFAVQYTLWIPEGVKQLRGVVVHQHGCGEGSAMSGQTGAFDWHWQALARAHDCALLSPSYEQPGKLNCQFWCDPLNGSEKRFLQALKDLGDLSGHAELADVPWALWGHSGGGIWCGAMTLLHPERVAAAWLRSGVPRIEGAKELLEGRLKLREYKVSEAVLSVPMMHNLGTREGVSDKKSKFAGVWPVAKAFHEVMTNKGALLGISVDPLSSHDCGNQRYLAIPWFDVCLQVRLAKEQGQPKMLKEWPEEEGLRIDWKDSLSDEEAKGLWLPNASVHQLWQAYVKDTSVPDESAPPAPFAIICKEGRLSWKVHADLQSGLSHFVILKDGKEVAKLEGKGKKGNRHGRTIYQGLQYSDTPAVPLEGRFYEDKDAVEGAEGRYQVKAVNTVGLVSE